MMKAGDFYKRILNEVIDGVYFVDPERRITFWNRAAESFTGYATADVVGKKCADNVLNHVDTDGRQLCSSGCPLHETLTDGKQRTADVFLHHRNGYRVPVKIKVAPVFDEHEQIIGAVEIFTNNEEQVSMEKQLSHYRRQAYTNALTEAVNRRHMDDLIGSSLNEKKRYDWPFSVVFFDIDDFKKVNDTTSHKAGDRVLQMVARTIQNNIRSSDILCRWGGEEFVVLLKNAGISTALEKAEQLRILVQESYRTWRNKKLSVTVSGGVAEGCDDDSIESLIDRADKAMYEAKRAGKNRIASE